MCVPYPFSVDIPPNSWDMAQWCEGHDVSVGRQMWLRYFCILASASRRLKLSVHFLLLLKMLQVTCWIVIWVFLEQLMGQTQKKERSSFMSGYLAFKQHLSLFYCRRSEGLSGRVLRKLPFLAHALYIQVSLLYSSKFILFIIFCFGFETGRKTFGHFPK